MTTDYSIFPASPLPLDTVDPSAAYKLMNKNSLPKQVKDLIDSVDSAISDHYNNGFQTLDNENPYTQNANGVKFCNYHTNSISSSSDPHSVREAWILQRDISIQLFKVMMELVRSASDIAKRHRECDRSEDIDLELAFHGDARGGFQWLNCLAKDDCDWVWASIVGQEKSLHSHCPACLLGRAIDSESTIRLLLAAARLYNWDFFVTSLRQHLLSDPWWGPGHWESIAPKAATLETQVRELLSQCALLRNDLQLRTMHVKTRRPQISSARAVSQGNSLRVQKTLQPKMEINFDALHAFLNLQMPQSVSGGSDRQVSRFHNKNSADYKLAVYCWFALVLGISSESPESQLPPLIKDLLWKSKVKTRSKTV